MKNNIINFPIVRKKQTTKSASKHNMYHGSEPILNTTEELLKTDKEEKPKTKRIDIALTITNMTDELIIKNYGSVENFIKEHNSVKDFIMKNHCVESYFEIDTSKRECGTKVSCNNCWLKEYNGEEIILFKKE